MLTSSQIESQLSKYKAWYWQHYPLCIFCGHRVNAGDLAHLVRRSYSIRLQTVKLNTGLAHRSCHQIFDDDHGQAIYLPRITEVMYIIWTIDVNYFNKISHNFKELNEIFARFPEVPKQKLDHHGELLQLDYLNF